MAAFRGRSKRAHGCNMLSLRKRAGRWYVRGTVRIGKETAVVAEHSTGTTERALAESYRARLQRETEARLLHGAAAVRREVTFDQAALDYLAGDGRHLSDISRVRALARYFAGEVCAKIGQAEFDAFCRQEIPNASPATRRRVKSVLSSICKCAGVDLPEIAIAGKARSVVAWLPLETAERLIAAYPKHVRPIATLAAYGGLRASELTTLRISAVDLSRPPHGAVIVRNPKNGRDRVVPLHARARDAIEPLLVDKKGNRRGDDECLFLNRYRRPYTDTRQLGGNPLSASHKAACKAAGVDGFRWHDWRHHAATWALRPVSEGGGGLDPLSLLAIFGWSSLSQVQRYAHASYETAAAGIARRA